nr:SHOCT domain-containing protein [Nocardiopsis kunsanensis]
MGLCMAVTVAAITQMSGPGPGRSPGVRGSSTGRGSRGPEVAGEGMDPALAELRLRYARGEVGREEFLQRKIDLE